MTEVFQVFFSSVFTDIISSHVSQYLATEYEKLKH